MSEGRNEKGEEWMLEERWEKGSKGERQIRRNGWEKEEREDEGREGGTDGDEIVLGNPSRRGNWLIPYSPAAPPTDHLLIEGRSCCCCCSLPLALLLRAWYCVEASSLTIISQCVLELLFFLCLFLCACYSVATYSLLSEKVDRRR